MKNKGFTLIELMVVIVIVGVLAGLAIPITKNRIDETRKQEAYAALHSIYSAQRTYYNQNNDAYTDLTNLTKDNLVVIPDASKAYYTYTVESSNATTFLAKAVKQGDLSDWISIDQDGKIGLPGGVAPAGGSSHDVGGGISPVVNPAQNPDIGGTPVCLSGAPVACPYGGSPVCTKEGAPVCMSGKTIVSPAGCARSACRGGVCQSWPPGTPVCQ